MSDEGLKSFGGLTVGDPVWFILKDGLARQGKVQSFFQQEGKDTAVSVFDMTDQRYRFMEVNQLSRKPLSDVKKKKHRKTKEKRERRSTKVF